MSRYYFHFLWSDDAVFDKEGVELDGLHAPNDAAILSLRMM